jgi:glucose/arabinose dehydrogenase
MICFKTLFRWQSNRNMLTHLVTSAIFLLPFFFVSIPAHAADTSPPTPPGGLRVTDLACRSANLFWTASTDDIGIAFYDVYHDGQLITTVNGNVLTATLTLVPGVNWGLYVNARDAAGNVSQASATLPTQVPQCQVDTQAPTAPTDLKGTVTGTSAALTWLTSTDNIGVAAYDVYRENVKVGSTGGLSFVDTGLSPTTSYQYSVAARDAQNNVSPRSASIALTTGSACTTPVCSVTEIVTETDIPWGLAALPDGSVLYSRRDAQDIVLLNPVTKTKTSIGTVPNVQGTDGEGGLLGLAITPNFPASDPWLYIYHTSPTDNRVVRIQYKNGVLNTATLQVLLSGIGRNKYHNGGRLRFGPDGKLYASTGDAQNGAFSQDVNNLAGKVLRLNPDGTRPADNPFNNYVWSYGHRNPQGLAFDSQGRLWQQEFGDGNMDETNLIQKGGNYGWPDCEGTASRGGSGCATAGYIAPKRTYPTSEGSCSGIAIVRDALYVACLRGTRLYRSMISNNGGGTELTNQQQFFSGTYGRLRTVEPSLDGGLWMANSDASGDKDSIPNNTNTKIFKVSLEDVIIKPSAGKVSDLNGDGKSDLLVQSSAGTTSAWLMNGSTITSTASLLSNDPGWSISHIADFNGDGKADLLWRNSNGAATIWLMNGGTVTGAIGILGADANWRVSNVGDFNGDGKADLLWRNSNGAATIWLMNGGAVTSAVGILGADANWSVSHVADFNGDGKADLLWRNTNGAATIWLMNGAVITSAVGILGADPNWRVSHTGDFNGDGKADILWRNTNGAATIWLMNGAVISSAMGILGADANWSVSHIGDFNGDGKSDLLWRNNNGAVTMWLMNGTAIASTAGLIGADANWRVSHIADLNGDDKSDIVWRKLDGAITAWLMNGVTASATAGLAAAGSLRVMP